MAKLQNVRTIDMAGGAITAIEYGGAVYSKVDGESNAGDIVRVMGRSWGKIEDGSFYRSKGTRKGFGGRYTDIEFQTEANGNVSDFEVFRKATESPQASAPFAEMVVSRVEAVEKRIDALEGAKDPETLVKGDRVLVKGRSIYGGSGDGEIGKFIAINLDGEYRVELGGNRGRLYKREQLTKVAGTEAPLRVGDYAIVLAKSSSLCGMIVEVRKEDAVAYDFRVYTLCGDKNELFDAHDLRKATDAEVAAATAPVQPKTGDIVVITANTNRSRNKIGDIGKVGSERSGISDSVRVIVDGGSSTNNFTLYSEMRLATPAEIAKYEAASVFTKSGRKPYEYRKGDVVRVLGTSGTVQLNVGQITEVVKPDGTDIPEVRSNDGWSRYAKVEIVCFAENRADLTKEGVLI